MWTSCASFWNWTLCATSMPPLLDIRLAAHQWQLNPAIAHRKRPLTASQTAAASADVMVTVAVAVAVVAVAVAAAVVTAGAFVGGNSPQCTAGRRM